MIDVISNISKIMLAVILAVLLGYAWYLYDSGYIFTAELEQEQQQIDMLPQPFYATPERIGSWYYIQATNSRSGKPLLLNEPLTGNLNLVLSVECFANEPYFTIRHSNLLALNGRIDLITQFGNQNRLFETQWYTYTTEASVVSLLPIDRRDQFYNQVATVQTLTLSVGSHWATFDVEHLPVAYQNIEC